jgi:hypothetical protein
MGNNGRNKSMQDFFGSVMDRMLGLQPVVVPERRMQNLAQKQAHIRAVGVREGFLAMRARSDEMTQRLRRARSNEAAIGDEAVDGEEIIELRSEH